MGSPSADHRVPQTARLPAEGVCFQMEAVSKICGTPSLLAILACVVVHQLICREGQSYNIERAEVKLSIKNNEKCVSVWIHSHTGHYSLKTLTFITENLHLGESVQPLTRTVFVKHVH